MLREHGGDGILPDQDVKGAVDALLAHMEVAAERDIESNRAGQPAIMKLKMLAEVCALCERAVLCTQRMHAGTLHACAMTSTLLCLGLVQQPPCILWHALAIAGLALPMQQQTMDG